MNPLDFFTRVSPYYDGFMKLVGSEKSIARTLAALGNLETGRRLLDVGGGTGTLAQAAQGLGVDVWVADTSEDMLLQAYEKGLPRDRLVLADAASLPFPNEYFDIVTCTDALHHFREPVAGLTGMAQVLRPEGELAILEFDRRRMVTQALAAIERLFGEPGSFFSPEELRQALASAGVSGRIMPVNRWQYLYHGAKI